MVQKADSIRTYPVPNVRKLLTPDRGFEMASIDLTGADAQTVAWEAGDEDLKTVFKENKIKLHAHNAKRMFKRYGVITGYEQPYYDLCRSGVHLCNFLGGDDQLAYAMGIPVYEAREFRNAWFDEHPLIQDWHARVQEQLMLTRTVRNVWGYERLFFDRIEGILPDAIAWIAQSGTGCICNHAAVNIDSWRMIQAGFAREEDFPDYVLAGSKAFSEMDGELLLQVHDELVLQYPQFYREPTLSTIKRIAHITVPYEDPLVIPWGLKTSTKSWGQCEKREWPTVSAKAIP
jgi:DNA polymerase I-like protein with 3'-5' exonuclease and polymerase domains